MANPVITSIAIAITPNIFGTSKRVTRRLLPKRSIWLHPKPARVQVLALSTRYLSEVRPRGYIFALVLRKSGAHSLFQYQPVGAEISIKADLIFAILVRGGGFVSKCEGRELLVELKSLARTDRQATDDGFRVVGHSIS